MMTRRVSWLALVLVAAACGGSSDGKDGAPGEDGASALIVSNEVAPGTECVAGGFRVESGVDADGNGALSEEETNTTDFICHGVDGGSVGAAGAGGATAPAGADGLTSLVNVTTVEPGTDCAKGGQRLEAGLDLDGNGTLEAGEVTTARVVCNGVEGSAGVAGRNSLIVTYDEPAGTNCPTGGRRIEVGPDTDNDAQLSDSEVAGTFYVCNGADGVDSAPGADGVSCWDLNANGACDPATEDLDASGACDVLDCAGQD
ncbi:MAG: hypothetical protein JW940_22535, partial [Polyangiaceae bacterium]|nr:hypothetical protein [Polyangiaceae bacterium]